MDENYWISSDMVTWVKIVNIIGLNVGLVERFYFVLHYFEVAIIFKLAF